MIVEEGLFTNGRLTQGTRMFDKGEGEDNLFIDFSEGGSSVTVSTVAVKGTVNNERIKFNKDFVCEQSLQ